MAMARALPVGRLGDRRANRAAERAANAVPSSFFVVAAMRPGWVQSKHDSWRGDRRV